jgi:pilus assembly protein FimV
MNMALKKVALGVMLAVPSLSFALGLGDIEVFSKLNQPLRAEIKLLYGDASEPGSTEVKLATDADFERVGMNRDVLPQNLSFEIARNDNGEFVIVVTTSEAVVDPFVDFLIDVNWSNGRLLREYVVLLDPPVTAPSAGPAQVTPLAEPDQQPVADIDFYKPAPEPEPEPEPEVSMPVSTGYPSGQNSYGPVVSGETLWVIARDSRLGQDISINQMMVMLLQMNPDAFFLDNINALKEGAILRLPSLSDFDSLSVSSATSAVGSQNQLWDDYRMSAARRAPTVSDDTAGAEYDYEDSSSDTRYTDSRLEIVPSAGDTQSDFGGAGGDPALRAELSDVQLELQRTREDLVSAGQENVELGSRVADLENLISNLERAVALKDADLADLQDALDLARDQVNSANAGYDNGFQDSDDGFTDDSGSTTDTGFDDTDDSVVDDGGMDRQPDQADSTPVEVDTSVSPAVGTVDTTTSRREQESGGVLSMLTNPLTLGGIALLLFGGAGFAFWRRRQAETAAGASLIDSFADDGDDGGLAETAMMQTSEMRLLDMLEKNPKDPQNHLALLRSYYATADRAAFVKAARRMLETIGGEDHPAWTEVRTMGANLAPDDTMFAVKQPGAEAAAEELAPRQDPPSLAIRSVTSDDLGGDDITDLDLDFSGDDQTAGAEDEITDLDLDFSADDDAAETDAGDDESEDDLSLDFDLDTDQTEDAAQTADDDGALDFDLDNMDLGGGSATDADTEDEQAGDPHTEFEIEAVNTEEPTAEPAGDFDLSLDNIDDPAAGDDDSASEADVLAALAGEDDGLDDLGLDDLDLGETSLADEEDAAGTKLELAKAYVSMGDPDGARGMLEEVIAEGSDDQKVEAQKLVDDL